jgi:hypothetical protein
MADQDRKDIRRKNLADKTYSKPSISEEQRFISKSKKQLKKKIEDIKAEELWEDWEDEIR